MSSPPGVLVGAAFKVHWTEKLSEPTAEAYIAGYQPSVLPDMDATPPDIAGEVLPLPSVHPDVLVSGGE